MQINSAKELKVYKAAYELAMKIFVVSKRFPPEERFALTGQIRRSSRSVCLNCVKLGQSDGTRHTSLAS
jgi:four helix bundle protein